jgi:hypothetical protein
LVLQGQTLGELGSSLITFGNTLVSIWKTQASKIDARGPQADMVKTIENCWFSYVFEGWGVYSGGLDGAWLSFWGTGWLKGGWLECWLVVAGVGWEGCREAGWPRGPPEPRDPGQARVSRHFGGPEPTQLSRRNPLINSGPGTRHQRLVTSD